MTQLRFLLTTTTAFALLFWAQPKCVNAQIQGMDDEIEQAEKDTLVVNLADYLPPLPVLIDSAIANSPQVEYFSQRQKMSEYEVAQMRKDWLNGLSINGSYFQGNNALIGNNLTLGGYNYGVGFNISLGQIFTMGDRVNQAKAAAASESAKKVEQERMIKQKVEETYNQLFILRDLIEHSTEAMESARFIYEQSQTRFVRGELSLDELGQQTDLKTKWASNYTRLRGEFYNTYRTLERIVGVPFSKF